MTLHYEFFWVRLELILRNGSEIFIVGLTLLNKLGEICVKFRSTMQMNLEDILLSEMS
jgi:hypothetical protein